MPFGDVVAEDVWLPTVAAVEQRCAELRQQWRTDRKMRALHGTEVW